MRLLAAISLLLAMGQVQGPSSTDEARKDLRPSLVEVGLRALGYARDGDWRRVSLSIVAIGPLAETLDEKWGTNIHVLLRQAAASEDVDQVVHSTLLVVYWDARDMLDPLEQGSDLDANHVKTRLLKAREALRFLGPVIRGRDHRLTDDGEPRDGRAVYHWLEKLLGKPLSYLPSHRAYGQNRNWRRDLQADVGAFLALLVKALPELEQARAPEEELP